MRPMRESAQHRPRNVVAYRESPSQFEAQQRSDHIGPQRTRTQHLRNVVASSGSPFEFGAQQPSEDAAVAGSGSALSAHGNVSGGHHLTNNATEVVGSGPAPSVNDDMSGGHHLPDNATEGPVGDRPPHPTSLEGYSPERSFAEELAFRLCAHVDQQITTDSDIVGRLIGSFATMIEKRASTTRDFNAAVLVNRGQR